MIMIIHFNIKGKDNSAADFLSRIYLALDNKNFDFKIGDLVLVKTFSDDKLSNIFEGPYTIKTIELKNNRLQIENFRVLRWESLRNIKRFYAEEGVSVVQPDLNLSDNVNLSERLLFNNMSVSLINLYQISF